MSVYRLIISFCICISHAVSGQNYDLVKEYKINDYDNYLGLNNGVVYPEKDPLLRDDPSYGEKSFQMAQLAYEGYDFVRKNIMYDVFRDELVILSSDQRMSIILNSDLVDQVSFSEGTVIVKKESNPGYRYHRNGFYRLVWDGEMKLLAKHRKSLQTFSSPSDYYRFFSKHTDYFVKKGDDWTLVENQNQLIRDLEVDKKAFKRYAKDLDLKFKRDKDNYLIELLRFSEKEIKEQ